MSLTHKSIFAKVKEYKGNPIDEYNKIQTFVKKECYFHYSIYSFLFSNFHSCKLLRASFIDLNDCLNSVNRKLDLYSSSKFEYLDESIQDELLDDFLMFCEIVLCVYYVTLKCDIIPNELYNNKNFDNQIFAQLVEIIKNSLKSMNHDFRIVEDENYEIIAYKCNPDAECVAEQSPINLKNEIYYYLGTKENDLKEKETHLHNIIDLIEPLLKTYKENKLVSKIEEYVQLLRHPEMKKNEKQYNWIFNNKLAYLDQLFMLCIFVKE